MEYKVTYKEIAQMENMAEASYSIGGKVYIAADLNGETICDENEIFEFKDETYRQDVTGRPIYAWHYLTRSFSAEHRAAGIKDSISFRRYID